MLKNNPALLLIDLQKGFEHSSHWGKERNNPDAEQVCYKLLSQWRKKKLPLFHIRHASKEENSPLNPKHPGFAFMELTHPLENEVQIIKQVNSAFIGTDLHQRIQDQKINTLVIVGLTTNHCISTTTRMAGNMGYETYLIEDATACFSRDGLHGEHFSAELIHATALANLHQEFAQVIDSKRCLQMLDL
jgi:nicotinamidase-related amidase